MFIKRDLRKIDEILSDESTSKSILKFSNRKAEFDGSLRVLCRESKLPFLLSLETLNLYANDLVNLAGIGLLSQTPIAELNLGQNKISMLPLEFGSLTSLKSLWLEDNELDSFPICVLQLHNLTSLRLSGNALTHLPATIAVLSNLEVLALDNNELTDFPVGCLQLRSLRQLWLRQNKIKALPSDLTGLAQLEVLSLSSNKISLVPSGIIALQQLRKLYLNGNDISVAPDVLSSLPVLEVINLSNNRIENVPESWSKRWGVLHANSGLLRPVEGTPEASVATPAPAPTVTLLGNPVIALVASR